MDWSEIDPGRSPAAPPWSVSEKKSWKNIVYAVFFTIIVVVSFAFIVKKTYASFDPEYPPSPYIQFSPTANPATQDLQWAFWGTDPSTLDSIEIDSNNLYYWNSDSDFYGTATGTGITLPNDGSYLYIIKSAGASLGNTYILANDEHFNPLTQINTTTVGDYQIIKTNSSFLYSDGPIRRIRFSNLSNAPSQNFFGFYYTNEELENYNEALLITYIKDALAWYNSSINIEDLSTKITQIIQPLTGTITASTTVTFEFNYRYGSDFPYPVRYAGITLCQVQDLICYSGNAEIAITQSIEEQTYLKTISGLQAGKDYIWKSYLRTASSSPGTGEITGEQQIFSVITPGGGILTNINETTSTTTILARFFGYQGYLAQKVPFVYFYDMAEILKNLDTNENEGNFPTLSLNLASSSLPMGSLVLFSSTTISQYAGTSNVTIFRNLMVAVLWLAFGAMMFHSVKNLFGHHK